MTSFSRPLLAVAALSCPASVDAVSANPVRKVVTLLQKMQERVIAEGETEKKLHDAFMCQCQTGSGNLAASGAAGTAKLPTLAANIKKAEEEQVQNKDSLAKAQADRTAAKTAVAEAGAMREKEASSYASEKAEYEANLAAMKKAVAALERGLAGAFLQTSGAQVVQQLAQDSKKLFEDDRQKLLSFLAGQQEEGESAPSTHEVVGLLKQMTDEMTAGLKEANAGEQKAIATYEELVAARTKELEALQHDIEERLKRNGDLAIQITQMKNDQTDSEEALAADQEALAGLEEKCKTATQEFETRNKVRGEELEALADTIKMLNSDDSLELFKKTLPGAASSLLQLKVGTLATRERALAVLSRVPQGPRRANIDLIALALRGNSAGFEKVQKMIDAMVDSLKAEQTDDNNKKEECSVQFDHADDSRKALERSESDEEKTIATIREDISTTADEIVALRKGLRNFDQNVNDAGKQRYDENADYKELMANNGAAKELLRAAKNRLQKFYNPKLATSFLSASSKKEVSSSVLAMIDDLVRDLDKEMTEAEAQEKNAQQAYKSMLGNAVSKKAADDKALTEKQAAKAQLEESLESHTEAKGDFTKELAATNQFIHALHLDCDWLIKYYDFRREARTNEIDALGKAKDVLNGADYALMQTTAIRSLRRAL